VVSGLTDPYYQDINANPDKAWYKVRAVYTTGGKTPITEYSTVATVYCPFTFNLADISDNIGEVTNRAYIDFSTPNADMKIEKSAGNLFYTKTDFSLSSTLFTPSMTRVYNSYANIETEMGKGFDYSYNGAIVRVKDGRFGKEDYTVFKDSDGRLYPFTRKVRGGAYTLKDPSVMRLTPEAITHSLKYGDGVGGGTAPTIKSTYSLRIDDTTFKYFNDKGELVLEKADKANFLIYARDDSTGLLYGTVNNAAESLHFIYNEGSDKVNRINMKDGSYFTVAYKNG
jgi:hypothetical protein